MRKAFADLRKKLERHLSRLRREGEYKRPARRERLVEMFPSARDAADAERRKLYFDLIEDHLDAVYKWVRRELIYLECNGDVPEGRLSVDGLVDATILRGLDEFEEKGEFSVSDWLCRIALETIRAEARAARRNAPDDSISLEHAPEAPAADPTESDQAIFEFFQPDDNPVLEDLLADASGADPEQAIIDRETQLLLHRTIAALQHRWRQVVRLVDLDGLSPERAAQILGTDPREVTSARAKSHAFLAERLADLGFDGDAIRALRGLAADAPTPEPVQLRT